MNGIEIYSKHKVRGTASATEPGSKCLDGVALALLFLQAKHAVTALVIC